MKNVWRSIVICAVLLGITVGFAVWRFRKKEEERPSSDKLIARISPPAPSRQSETPNAVPEQKAVKPSRALVSDPVLTPILEDLTKGWEQLGNGLTGEALLARQRRYAAEAVSKLGGSDELLKFLDFLKEKGANDLRDWVIKTAAGDLFTGEHASASRDWLRTVDDAKLREALCYQAGERFTGPGLKEFIASFELDDHCQSAVITGYCKVVAKNDPDLAMKTFFDLKPPKMDASGLTMIYTDLPPTSDFVKLASKLPEDSKTLARTARTALLQSWATAKPEEAAQYVLSNTTLASPMQMGTVVGTWAKTSPDAAAKWVSSLSAGTYRDEGTAALAGCFSKTDPVKAWQHASQVGDFQKRVDTATVVFKDWERIDHNGATAAWNTLFNAGQ